MSCNVLTNRLSIMYREPVCKQLPSDSYSCVIAGLDDYFMSQVWMLKEEKDITLLLFTLFVSRCLI